MRIEQATSENDWNRASKILLDVVDRLDRLGKSLWTEKQVTVNSLKDSYKLNELFFLNESGLAGIVFLQESDPFFWPEVTEADSLFIHKLAVLPSRSGEQLGQKALSKIIELANEKGLKWVRLDCDDRPELHEFYTDSGFTLVDIRQVEEFRVSRYQLLTKSSTRPYRAMKNKTDR